MPINKLICLYKYTAYESILSSMNTKILKNLGNELKYLRREKDLTQEELAEKIGVHPTYIGKIEGGKSNPSAMLLYKISRALNIKMYRIFEFDK